MDIEHLKKIKKEKKMKLQEISDLSGIPKRTVDGIFSGKTKNPRIDTMQAIERALGIDEDIKKSPPLEITEGEKELLDLFNSVPDEQQQLVLQMIRVALENK